jgi:hypothetical protein
MFSRAGLFGLGALAGLTRAGSWAFRNPASAGAIAGAGWGMMSDDTSVLGGAAMGAGLGMAGRYGLRGARGLMRNGIYGASLGLRSMARRDYRGAVMAANTGFNKITGLWR